MGRQTWFLTLEQGRIKLGAKGAFAPGPPLQGGPP